jgi:GT2 family glycosyltransferase
VLWSFVVPAWNEQASLPASLEALHASARTAGVEYEIIVADDASTDRTALVAKEHGAKVVGCEHRQIAATRNTGARAASGQMLVFVDADTLVGAGTVSGIAEALERGAVYGCGEVRWDERVPLWFRPPLWMMSTYFRWAGLAYGAFLFVRREAFEAVGGFDERFFAGEELELSRLLRKQGRFGWVKQPVVTSGRKLRTYGTRELLARTLGIVLRGKRGLKKRDRLDLWYGERRKDD